jgi:HAD superfamily hydrolase (TIGR01509 family)
MSGSDASEPASRVLLALDVDGVVLDPERGGNGPWQGAFGDHFGVDASRLDTTLFAAAWADVITGRRPVESALAEALARLGWDMGVEAALRCWFEADFVVAPAVLEAVTTWSALGIPLALVSNQEPRRARYLEQHLAPVLPIGGTAFSGDLGVVKQQVEFYERAERRLGVAGLGPAVVFLDDSPANVDAAGRHGWTAIHFSQERDWRSEVADALERVRGTGHVPAL